MDPIEEARAAALAQVAALTAAHEEIVAASAGSNADDEHDPEGATIAFERQQVSALLDQARATVDALDEAIARRAAGCYGRCASCGGAIGDERLAARPQATTCIVCASPPRRRGVRG